MHFSFYIYYEVNAQNEDKVRAAVRTLQKSLAGATGVQGRLLCRRRDCETEQ